MNIRNIQTFFTMWLIIVEGTDKTGVFLWVVSPLLYYHLITITELIICLVFRYLYIFFFFLTSDCTAPSRGNLVLRHSVRHFSKFGGIACWVTLFNPSANWPQQFNFFITTFIHIYIFTIKKDNIINKKKTHTINILSWNFCSFAVYNRKR